MKTNAARILDAHHIRYDIREYDVTDDVAAKIGVRPEQVFIPGGTQLDLKALAKRSGDRARERMKDDG